MLLRIRTARPAAIPSRGRFRAEVEQAEPHGMRPAATPPDDYVNNWWYHDGQGNDFVVYHDQVWRCDLADPNAFPFDWSCQKDPSGPMPQSGWPGCDAIPECRE
jgi:hypothetical protein